MLFQDASPEAFEDNFSDRLGQSQPSGEDVFIAQAIVLLKCVRLCVHLKNVRRKPLPRIVFEKRFWSVWDPSVHFFGRRLKAPKTVGILRFSAQDELKPRQFAQNLAKAGKPWEVMAPERSALSSRSIHRRRAEAAGPERSRYIDTEVFELEKA